MFSFVNLISYPPSQNCPSDRSGCCSEGRIVALVVDWWRGWGRGRWDRLMVADWFDAMVAPLGVRTVTRCGEVTLF